MLRTTRDNLINRIFVILENGIEKANAERNAKKAVRFVKIEKILVDKFYSEEI